MGLRGKERRLLRGRGLVHPVSGVRAVFQEVRGGFGLGRGSREFRVGAGSGCGEDVACGADA